MIRYSSKMKIKKVKDKTLKKVFSPIVNCIEVVDSKIHKLKDKKRYSEKQIKKLFKEKLDFYLYESSSEFDGDNEAILLIPEMLYADEYDVYHYYNFHGNRWPNARLFKKLSFCRQKQFEEFQKTFDWLCSFTNELTMEEKKKICEYTIDGRTCMSYDLYRVLEGRPVYMITRKLFEEKIVNG